MTATPTNTTPQTQGAHHIGLTVPDIVATRDFFTEILGFSQVGEVSDYPAFFVSDGTVLLTLWQASDPATATKFDRKNNIGLHHFALKVGSLEVLQSLYETLKTTPGIEIEFAPEPVGKSPLHHMIFFIPGGIRMELITTPS